MKNIEEVIQLVIEELVALGNGKQIPREDRMFGLCNYMEGFIKPLVDSTLEKNYVYDLESLVGYYSGDSRLYEKFVGEWEFFSGNLCFPVPCKGYRNPDDAYDDTEDLWVGEYGDTRRKLCLYLAERLEELVKDRQRKKEENRVLQLVAEELEKIGNPRFYGKKKGFVEDKGLCDNIELFLLRLSTTLNLQYDLEDFIDSLEGEHLYPGTT